MVGRDPMYRYREADVKGRMDGWRQGWRAQYLECGSGRNG